MSRNDTVIGIFVLATISAAGFGIHFKSIGLAMALWPLIVSGLSRMAR